MATSKNVHRPLGVGAGGPDVEQLQRAIADKARSWKLPPLVVDQKGPLSQRDVNSAAHLLFAMGAAGDVLEQARKRDRLTEYAQRLLRGTRPRSPKMLRLSRKRRDEVREWRAAGKDVTGQIIPRAEWGARPPQGTLTPQTVVNQIFVHHTVFPALNPTATRAEEEERMRALQRFHQDSRGYTDVAYQAIVFPSGRIYEGRPLNFVGAHTLNQNSTSKAVCFDGNFEESRPTQSAIEAARFACHFLGADKPIRPHGDVFPTACPGANVKAILASLQR